MIFLPLSQNTSRVKVVLPTRSSLHHWIHLNFFWIMNHGLFSVWKGICSGLEITSHNFKAFPWKLEGKCLKPLGVKPVKPQCPRVTVHTHRQKRPCHSLSRKSSSSDCTQPVPQPEELLPAGACLACSKHINWIGNTWHDMKSQQTRIWPQAREQALLGRGGSVHTQQRISVLPCDFIGHNLMSTSF